MIVSVGAEATKETERKKERMYRASPQSQVPLSRAHSVSSSDAQRPNLNADPKGLESSLQNLLTLHSHNSLILRHHTEKAKKEAIKKAERVSELLVEAVNGGVQDSFVYEKRIEQEIRALSATVAKFMKQTDQWLAATHALNTAVKEIGDFENWMKIMEYDCKSITAAIQNIHQD